MCGISGIWTNNETDQGNLPGIIEKSLRLLDHRGPDDSGHWHDPLQGIALGHTRLSIIDLTKAACQPMKGPSGKTFITYNGEIYNYIELRDALLSEGITFRTKSDTEVILALYERYGVQCVGLLRGMFAFGIWDARSHELILARDRLGKKPLYYAASEKSILFASEIKALRTTHDKSLFDIDHSVIDQYLSFGFISGPGTVYKGIIQLPPATVLVASALGNYATHRYWDLAISKDHNRSFQETVEEADTRITESIRLRLRADVPVGVFLSGGIDSGIVTAIASRLQGKSLPTFTVGFEDSCFDERGVAKQISDCYGTDHHEVLLRLNVPEMIPNIARAYDQPFADASAVPTFCIAQFVHQEKIKVILNGDGGDELFLGYRRALAAAWLSKITDTKVQGFLSGLAGMVEKMLPAPRIHRNHYALAHRFLRGLAVGRTKRLLIWSSDGFTYEEKQALGYTVSDNESPEASLDAFLPDSRSMSFLDQSIALDLLWMLPYALLVKMDIATMSYGLEARSPFLDHELVGWANSIPNAIKLHGFSTKPVLREVALKYLSPQICSAPKRGFEVPLQQWLNEDLREIRDDLILGQQGILTTIFSRAALERFVRQENGIDGRRWANLVWSLLMLSAWDTYANKF